MGGARTGIDRRGRLNWSISLSQPNYRLVRAWHGWLTSKLHLRSAGVPPASSAPDIIHQPARHPSALGPPPAPDAAAPRTSRVLLRTFLAFGPPGHWVSRLNAVDL